MHEFEIKEFIFLISGAITAASEKKAAVVPRYNISAVLGTSIEFSCESTGEPLISCIWSHTTNGKPQIAIFDDTVDKAGALKNADGVSYFAHELQQGRCSVRIEALTEAHLGKWSCVLIAENVDVFDGHVEVKGRGKWTWKFET